jgi:endonuclease I
MVVSGKYTLSGVSRINQVLFLIGFAALQANAQLYPGLTGENLADAIRNDFTPGQVLNENQAKDTLYAKVFAEGDSVRCIYSGLSRYLPADADPSQWLYGTGLEVGSINLEHGWPQAKGAGEGTDGNTNMYHLFPSRTGINSDRANFPYRDIQDNQTQKWYYRGIEMNAKPTSNISAYSEFAGGMFEPRESVKGDIARGMFYFWTIYRQDALAADPFYFDAQLPDLCLWHDADPVDAAELQRNALIARYQDDKDNPFIIDCSLVMRAYCSQLAECIPVSTVSYDQSKNTIQYLPAERRLTIKGEGLGAWQVALYDSMGRKVFSQTLLPDELSDTFTFSPGVYFVHVVGNQRVLNQSFYLP